MRALASSLLLSGPAVLAAWLPGAAGQLQATRDGIAGGEVWRLVTGHWTHWSWDHLAWDLLAFVVLMTLALRIDRTRTWLVLAASALMIPIGVFTLMPAIDSYRGLSGIDSALFAFVAASLFWRCRSEERRGDAGWIALVGVGFAAKLAYETLSGATVFADPTGFVPLPLAHVIGAAIGLVAVPLGLAPQEEMTR